MDLFCSSFSSSYLAQLTQRISSLALQLDLRGAQEAAEGRMDELGEGRQRSWGAMEESSQSEEDKMRNVKVRITKRKQVREQRIEKNEG